MEKIEPREAESISVKQALEWLAMGWIPYIDRDERLVSEDRESIRGFFDGNKIKEENEHLYTERQVDYCNRMHTAVAALENILDKGRIKIYFPDEFYDENQLEIDECYGVIEESSLTSFSIKVWPKESLVLYMTAYYGEHELGRFYVINDCFKFSELKKIEPLFMDNKQEFSKSVKKVDQDSYTTPELQIINEVIKKYGERINRVKSLECKDIIRQKARELKISLSGRQITAIYTVIRKPEAKVGGAKPQKKKTKV